MLKYSYETHGGRVKYRFLEAKDEKYIVRAIKKKIDSRVTVTLSRSYGSNETDILSFSWKKRNSYFDTLYVVRYELTKKVVKNVLITLDKVLVKC